MNESTARAERYDIPPSPLPSYTWTVPQKPISVCFPLDIIDRLEHEAVESFRSLSSRGSEIGGVLFGTVAPGSPTLITIASYDPVVSDYSRGPLYRLSEIDLVRFSKAMEAGARNGLVPVGFFRSHTRKGLSMDPDDVALLDSKFAGPSGMALLIRPFATKASIAGVFFREDGSIRTESSWLEFPFRASELAGRLGAAQSEPVTARPAAPPVPAPKATPRAQIVPIASRREIATPPPLPPVAATEPEPPAPVVVPPAPTPAAKAEAPPAKVEPPAAKTEAPAAKIEVPAAKAEVPSAKIEPPAAKAETPVAPPPAPAEPPAAAASPETVHEPEAEPAEAVPAARSGKIVMISVGAALIVLIAVSLFVYPGFLRHSARPTAAVQDTSPLALRVERSGGELVLTWNRDSAAIRNASHAVLSITDGTQQENVNMDLAQLRGAGSISYSPATADVVFKMEVTGPDQARTTSESVRVLRTRPSPMEEQQQQAAGMQVPAATTAPAAQPQTVAGQPQPEGVSDQPEAARTPAAPLKRFSTDSLAQRLRPTRPADLPAAPAIPQQSSGSGAGLAVLNLGGPAVAPPPPPPAAAPQSAPPATAKRAPQTGGQIQQAQLIRRKDPEYPRLAKESGAHGTVELIATVGTDGKVKSVKVVKGHPLLQRAAVDAVMQWLYRPTILNGVPVETQTQIFLNFVGDR
jgi:TonB family protein